ncbi:hypothetical protein FEM48_Zijuj01G0237300 [Ziziphus jujuba var. spinosa]|uniref:Uncharacterized protein n=1 Tax=Ziziphus jujuba var. spinosa TaxID=714518 RepID=A0A978W493_ZIZJJ|nr:uncharacterized protein LOC107432648 [Ziziphus jujuba var. spinosa]KAH7546777.1 hypothetical protein FEM48_Zijuj01G0237300 [Ziziphus jujuba var. spinosa]
MGGYIFLSNTIFSKPSIFKPSTPCLFNPIKRLSEARKAKGAEKAPSTADVIKSVAEEKLRAAEQGVASQTSDKTYDGAEEATLGDSKVQSAKERLEEHEPGVDYRRRGDNHG